MILFEPQRTYSSNRDTKLYMITRNRGFGLANRNEYLQSENKQFSFEDSILGSLSRSNGSVDIHVPHYRNELRGQPCDPLFSFR